MICFTKALKWGWDRLRPGSLEAYFQTLDYVALSIFDSIEIFRNSFLSSSLFDALLHQDFEVKLR